jgi:hypothetical protein
MRVCSMQTQHLCCTAMLVPQKQLAALAAVSVSFGCCCCMLHCVLYIYARPDLASGTLLQQQQIACSLRRAAAAADGCAHSHRFHMVSSALMGSARGPCSSSSSKRFVSSSCTYQLARYRRVTMLARGARPYPCLQVLLHCFILRSFIHKQHSGVPLYNVKFERSAAAHVV